MTPKTLILVVGCHRSGTSAVAGSLSKLGVSLGDNLMPPSPANPKGYFEDLDAVAANDGLLDSVGCSWDRPPRFLESIPSPAPTRFRAMARDVVERLAQSATVFAVKDPRATFLADFWHGVCRDLGVRFRVLHVERKIEAATASLVARENWSPERAEDLVRRYQQAAYDLAEAYGPTYQLIQFPYDLPEVAIWKGIFEAFDVKHALPVPDMAAVRDFVDERLVHHG